MTSQQGCDMFGSIGIIVQVLLGAGAFTILLLKRNTEKPKRQWKIWILDSSKQAISQIFAHLLNVGFSQILSNQNNGDPCNWYFITISLDTTIGIFICYLLLSLVEYFFQKYGYYNLKSGNYIKIISQESQILDDNQRKNKIQTDQIGERSLLRPIITVDILIWSLQLLIWILIVLIAKSSLYGIQLALSNILEAFSQFLFSNLDSQPNIKLILVMVIIPLFLNGFQFWIQDNFLKKKEFTQIEKQFAMSEMYEMEFQTMNPKNDANSIEQGADAVESQDYNQKQNQEL